MASTSFSPIEKSFKYDVFLSFRGEDTRNNFVGHLYQALKQKGIETYKDDEKIEKGNTIDDQLIKSIEDSRFYIIVLSKNYASSSWCLDELVKIMECQKTREQTAYPIFFYVEPTEVRKQSGAVKEAFAKHEKEEAAGKWRGAMKEASNLAGWELKATANGDESKLILIIVDVIFERLSSINFSVDGKLVGMETRIKKILSILEMGTQDVRIIGITGMGGGGKTTLAEAVCDQISLHFEGISFVENVRVVSKESLSGLQKQILADVLNKQDIIVSSVRNGKKMMGNMMRGRKVLIVLDDVDHKRQLEALAGDVNWFKSGSRIIITTRDEQVLVSHGVSLICNVNLLTDEEANCLFRRYASGKEILSQGCNEMSRQVVRYAAGLPLTIKVLGSSLRGKSELEWKDALERLEKVPEHETQEILKISYDALENDYREIFLDVACILKGEQKDKAIRVLKSCGFHARIGLSVLEKKSLISISKYGSLGMHDRIEEMGKYIDCHLHPDEHNRHSRLWIEKEIEDILDNNRINEAIRCIKLSPRRLDLRTFMTGLRNMKKVRVLYLCSGSNWDDSRVSQLFPNSLQYLCWRAYPFSSLHETFQADNLVGLDMSFSSILEVWKVGNGKALTKLRFLDLSHTSLRRLNLELTPNLERLDVTDCWDLVEINAPAGCLKNLLYLDLSGSGGFKYFLFDKQSKSLFVESKDKCALHPNNNLPKYNFTCLYKEDQVASSYGNLEKLISIGLCACTNFESFSRSIRNLQCLRKLTLEGGVTEVPKDLHHLLHLEELSLSKTKIKYLPDSICRLKQLKSINLEYCHNLEKLPEDFGQLDALEELILSNSKIKQLPDSVYMLKQLKNIKLQGCMHLKRLPESFGQLECQEKIECLESLQELDITGTAISHLPQCILRLKGVRIIGSKMMLESFGFTHEIENYDDETFVNITGDLKQESPVPLMTSSSIQNSFKYDVFLSFRGEDTRKNFVDHLYHALMNKGIYTFKDNENIQKGKRVSDDLFKSIQDSKFYIIVFSKNYASSSWCLEELVKIMECEKMTGHIAYPVFYDVEPTEVRKQIGAVGKAFAKHENEEAAGKWRETLKEAADLAGFVLESIANGHEAKFIQEIIEKISIQLNFIDSSSDGDLIGMKTRVNEVISSLEPGVGDVRMLGIWGMGGAGKTTLARAVFNQISIQFEGQSFVENVREVSKTSLSGLKSLQKQVLSDVLKDQNIEVSSVSSGKSMMQRRLCGIKVLVVLDDVVHKHQLEALAGDLNWFKPGSRIIITTRDKQVLTAHGVELIHNVTLLSQAEAGCLFSRLAFGRENPTHGYEELSGKVLEYAGGLPLTIKVMGSHLRGLDESEWKDAIKRLERIPFKDTMKVLELSYDGL